MIGEHRRAIATPRPVGQHMAAAIKPVERGFIAAHIGGAADLGRVQPDGERALDHPEARTGALKSDAEVEILPLLERGVEQHLLGHPGRHDHRRGLHELVGAEEIFADILVFPNAAVGADPVAIDASIDFHPRIENRAAAVARQRFRHGRQLAGQEQVVGIEEGDVAPLGGENAPIARCATAGIVLPDVTQARVANRLDHRAGIVMRAIIDDDDLEIGPVLRQYRPDRVGDHVGAVVERDDDGEEGDVGHAPWTFRYSS